MKRPLTASLLALVVAAVLSACGGEPDSTATEECTPAHPDIQTNTPGVLTLVSFNSPPFSIVERDELLGIDGKILEEIAKLECLDLKVSAVAPAALIPAVQAGRADLAVGGIYRTAARAEVVDVTDPLFLDQMGIISEDGVSELPEMKGKKVGTVDGYFWVEDLKSYFGSDLSIYATPENLFQDIKTGRIDVAVDSFGVGKVLGEGFQVKVATPFAEVPSSTQGFQTGYYLQKGNDSLLAALNENIAKLREDGTLARILADNGLDPSAADTGEPRLIQ